jgi:DNA-directed RNA polymerase subunit RPC12/RpoP
MKITELKQLIKETINEAFFIGEDQTITCEKCGWGWKLDAGGKDPYTCHKCGHDNSEIDEYDVENVDDMKEFLQFMKEYNQKLDEAECGCVYEAQYHGREVQLGKPMQGDIKKFKVYVKNPKGKVVKVNFGAHGMNIKKNNPKRRKAYRARHHCDNPGPRTKANYWSCRKW